MPGKCQKLVERVHSGQSTFPKSFLAIAVKTYTRVDISVLWSCLNLLDYFNFAICLVQDGLWKHIPNNLIQSSSNINILTVLIIV